MDGICIYLALFSLTWLILGLYNVLISQAFSNKWNEFEYNFSKREHIFRQYETLHLQMEKGELNKGQKNEYFEKREALEYFLTRQEFIAPTFLPTIAESFLRDDFYFAGYLGRAIAKCSEKAFKLSVSSLLVITLISFIWYGIIQFREEIQVYCQYFF